MRKSILATALAGVLVWAGVASAGPLAPSLSTDAVTGAFNGPDATLCGVFSCIAGEGALPNFQRGQTIDGVFIGPGAVQHIDWIVIHDPAGLLLPGVGAGASNGSALATDDDYLYLYQLENSSVFALNNLNVGGPSNPPNAFGFKVDTEGFLTGKDLDLNADTPGGEGHCNNAGACGSANFGNLGDQTAAHAPFPAVNETERTGAGAALAGLQDPNSVSVDSLFVTFGNPAPVVGATRQVDVGEESSILFVRGTKPAYGNAVTSGSGSSGSPVAWGTSNQEQCSATAQNANGGVCPGAFIGDELGVQIPVPTQPPPTNQVPEPASLLLLGSGLAGLGFWARRRQN